MTEILFFIYFSDKMIVDSSDQISSQSNASTLSSSKVRQNGRKRRHPSLQEICNDRESKMPRRSERLQKKAERKKGIYADKVKMSKASFDDSGIVNDSMYDTTLASTPLPMEISTISQPQTKQLVDIGVQTDCCHLPLEDVTTQTDDSIQLVRNASTQIMTDVSSPTSFCGINDATTMAKSPRKVAKSQKSARNTLGIYVLPSISAGNEPTPNSSFTKPDGVTICSNCSKEISHTEGTVKSPNKAIEFTNSSSGFSFFSYDSPSTICMSVEVRPPCNRHGSSPQTCSENRETGSTVDNFRPHLHFLHTSSPNNSCSLPVSQTRQLNDDSGSENVQEESNGQGRMEEDVTSVGNLLHIDLEQNDLHQSTPRRRCRQYSSTIDDDDDETPRSRIKGRFIRGSRKHVSRLKLDFKENENPLSHCT